MRLLIAERFWPMLALKLLKVVLGVAVLSRLGFLGGQNFILVFCNHAFVVAEVLLMLTPLLQVLSRDRLILFLA